MQPQQLATEPLCDRARAQIMEQVILDVRRHWFGAVVQQMGNAVSAVESGGQMVMLTESTVEEAEEILDWAAESGVYVIETGFTRPPDLAFRLKRRGFRLIQRHGEYLFTPAAGAPGSGQPPRPGRHDWARQGLLAVLLRREPVEPAIEVIDEARLADWNSVCWRAFGGRISEAESLAEKRASFSNMGPNGHWYLAQVNGRPVGTAILYQGEEAAQVLAVGTLPAYRGRGIATAVMRRIIRDWQTTGKGFLFLDAAPGSSAERLYLGLGFQKAYLRCVYAPPSSPSP